MEERLQKILSARGICSRRKAEEYIVHGLVKVNGVAASLGQKADPSVDRIEVDGRIIEEREEMLYYLMHKPVGVLTSNVDSSRTAGRRRAPKEQQADGVPTVRDLLPAGLRGKIYPVGRLDKDSSGLLLLTNDGVLAYRLTHPKFDHEKEYEVTTARQITDGQLRKLSLGITIMGEKTKPATVRRVGLSRFRIALTEGRNRQIRRMCQKIGAPVQQLQRVRILTVVDRKLQTGEGRFLTESERKNLCTAVGIGVNGKEVNSSL